LWGARMFPGGHHHAAFQVHEKADHYRVALDSDDGHTHLLVEGDLAPELPRSSIFGSLKQASAFFERGSLGSSVTATPNHFDGLELRSFDWDVQPLAVEHVESSFFEAREFFPAGREGLSSALVMRCV